MTRPQRSQMSSPALRSRMRWMSPQSGHRVIISPFIIWLRDLFGLVSAMRARGVVEVFLCDVLLCAVA